MKMRKIVALTMLLLLIGCAASYAFELNRHMSDRELLNGYYEVNSQVDDIKAIISKCRERGRDDLIERAEKQLMDWQDMKSAFVLELRRRGIQP